MVHNSKRRERARRTSTPAAAHLQENTRRIQQRIPLTHADVEQCMVQASAVDDHSWAVARMAPEYLASVWLVRLVAMCRVSQCLLDLGVTCGATTTKKA